MVEHLSKKHEALSLILPKKKKCEEKDMSRTGKDRKHNINSWKVKWILLAEQGTHIGS
jgi:hypothetical protein